MNNGDFISIKDRLPGPADTNAHGQVIVVAKGIERPLHWITARERPDAIDGWRPMRITEGVKLAE